MRGGTIDLIARRIFFETVQPLVRRETLQLRGAQCHSLNLGPFSVERMRNTCWTVNMNMATSST